MTLFLCFPEHTEIRERVFADAYSDSESRQNRCLRGYDCESYQALAGLVDVKAPGPGEMLVKGAVIVVHNTIFFRVVYSSTKRVGHFRRDRCASC